MPYQYNCQKKYDFFKKGQKKEGLLKFVVGTTALAEVAQPLSLINLAKKYIKIMSNVDLNIVEELGLTSIKKYWKYAKQIKIKLDWLYYQILTLAIFIKYLHKIDNNKKITENINARQNIDLEQMLYFVIQLKKSIQY